MAAHVKLSKGQQIGLGVGAVVAAGVVYYFWHKSQQEAQAQASLAAQGGSSGASGRSSPSAADRFSIAAPPFQSALANN